MLSEQSEFIKCFEKSWFRPPEIGEGFGEWSEAPSYEEGVGGDGEQQGFALQNVYSLS